MSPSLLPKLSCLPKLMAPFTCQSFIHLLSNQPTELDQVLSLVLDKQKIGLYRVLSLVLNKLQLSPRCHHIAYPQPFLYPIASAPNIAGCAYHKIDMSTLRKESRETQSGTHSVPGSLNVLHALCLAALGASYYHYPQVMVGHDCNPRWRQEDKKFKIILGYTESRRPFRDT